MNGHEASIIIFRRYFKKWQEDFNCQLSPFISGGKKSHLQKRNAEIIAMRQEGKTLGEIADKFNISNEPVRQIIAKFAEQVRKYCRANYGSCKNCNDMKDDNNAIYCDACISAKKLIDFLVRNK